MAGINELYKAAGGASSGLTEEGIKKTFEVILAKVREGEDVLIKGFGTFKKVHTAAREGINPQKPTEKIQIPAKDHLKFKASSAVDLTPPKKSPAGRRRG